jgi:rhodanese-related sulfurtransferase
MKSSTNFFLTVFFLLTGYLSPAQSKQQLSPDAFEQLLQEKESVTVVDVRTPSEYQQGHLANSINLDIYSKEFKTELNKLDKGKPVFLYCASGGRSNSALQYMTNAGFKEVYNLAGGIQAWEKARKPVVK